LVEEVAEEVDAEDEEVRAAEDDGDDEIEAAALPPLLPPKVTSTFPAAAASFVWSMGFWLLLQVPSAFFQMPPQYTLI
jgi:hypothetical protein